MDAATAALRLAALESEAVALRRVLLHTASASAPLPSPDAPLPAAEAAFFSRQALCAALGPACQRVLRSLHVVVVGAGGLGCPAALYLARSGVGALTIVDGDAVEASNLPRQVCHEGPWAGLPKAESLAAACARGVPFPPRVRAVVARLTGASAPALLRGAHLVVDATDNARARYVLSDACALAAAGAGLAAPLPLVSGAALGTDGQVAVYHWPGGGCLRCAFPAPPPAGAAPGCADAGVAGPVTGAVGCLMAMEVLKCAAAWARGEGPPRAEWGDGGGAGGGATAPPPPLLHRPTLPPPGARTLLCLDGAAPRLRAVGTRGRRSGCALCGDAPTLRSLADSEAWADAAGLPCGEVCRGLCVACAPAASPAQVAAAWAARGAPGGAAPLLDVRVALQRDLALPCGPGCRSAHAPLAALTAARAAGGAAAVRATVAAACGGRAPPEGAPVIALCRRGVDSAEAAALLVEAGFAAAHVAGGWEEWARAGGGAGAAVPY
jgi:molybdopterin/thiamine biosynthesis adenylyltransferase/rhodanese-related sulfurtransferase